MNHQRAWPASEIGLIVLASVLIAIVSIAQASVVVSIELDYEVEGLDLDTDTVSELDLLEDVEWDVLVAYNSDRDPHAVVVHNATNGATLSFLDATPFESVTHDDVADLTFTENFVDQPLGDDDTVVVKTDTGAYFKMGHATPTDGGVSFDYQRLESPFAENRAEPDEFSVMVARLDDSPSLPAGLSKEDWGQIQALIRESEYRVTPREGEDPEFQARNIEHHLRMHFDKVGVHVAPVRAAETAWEWHLALHGYGHENEVRNAEKAQLVAEGNRIEYRRGDLVEWYVNDERGLEHGFTVARRPGEKPNSGLLRFEMALSGSLEARSEEDGSAIVFGDARGETVLRYAGLRVWDADGRDLPARMVVGGQVLALLVDDRDAIYPVTVDPTLTVDAKLTASDAAAEDHFGRSVALSGDTALVGAYGDDDVGYNSGSAYVFTLSGTTWSEQAKLTASDGAAENFLGYSVALSGDTALVGALGDDHAGLRSGSAYVFTLSGTTWSEQAKLTASDGAAGDTFGLPVALSGDTALVGANWDDDVGYNSGSAYVFARNGTTWTEQAKLTASDGAKADVFGRSVALSGDTALVGAEGDDDAGSSSGSAYVFTRTGTTWTEQAKLTASDAAAYDHFGGSVALSGDTALVGAYRNDDAGSSSGSAYVFIRTGTTWNEQVKLTASDAAAYDQFGRPVALSGDTALVGAYQNDDVGYNSGSAYLFARSGTTWSEAKLTASDAAAYDHFGISVALSGDVALVGASEDDDAGSASGSAYVFDLNNTPPVALCRDVTIEAGMDCGIVSPEDIDDGSYDPDGDPITLGLDPSGPYPAGDTIVALIVADDQVASTRCTAIVTVVDTTPPSLSVSVTPDTLWPPNHRMIDVRAAIGGSDNCGGRRAIILVSVASSEPDDAPGMGDGHTVDDIQDAEVGTADFGFTLRAERAGTGDGREYTAIYTATDASGNETSAASVVSVPHDQGGEAEPLVAAVQDSVSGTLVTWTVVEDALHYNVSRGNLANIHETETAIELGQVICIEARSLDETTEGWEDSEIPPPGEVFFYLVEYDNGTSSSYGTESVSKPRVVESGGCE